jgi:intein-encoded DNA endonuclease-like protein
MPSRKIEIDSDKNKIIELYLDDKKTTNEIGIIYGCHGSLIGARLREWGIRMRSNGESHRKYFLDEDYFKIVDTEDKAYFLGLLYADGCNEKGRVVSLGLIDVDKPILDKFKEYLKHKGPMYLVEKEKESRFTIRDYYKFTIYSKKMSEDLSKLGCFAGKTYTLSFPAEKQVPKHLINHFIRGYFDGDGCLYTYKWKKPKYSSVIFVSSKIFCLGLKKYLERIFDFKSWIYDKANGIAELRIFGIKNTLSLLDFLYTDAINFLDRKNTDYNKLKEFFKQNY